MINVLRRVPLSVTIELALMLIALSSMVAGMGKIIRGAEASAFLPAAMPAVILGWWLGRTSKRTWLVLGGLALLGILLLWGLNAGAVSVIPALAAMSGAFLFENFIYLHGSQVPFGTTAGQMEMAVRGLLTQSAALWARVDAWLAGLVTGKNVNDPVVLVLVWSLLLWMLAAWAGWEAGHRRPLAGLVPGLAVLAFITKYTGTDVTALWLMVVSLLGLLGIARHEENQRSWISGRVDFSELIVMNTAFSAVLVILLLGTLGYLLPMISVKDMLESFRRHPSSEEQTAKSLGLEPARAPATAVPSIFYTRRPDALPNNHLLGSGPELSGEVVFTVQTGEMPPVPVMNVQNMAPRHYWRSYSFDIYTGSGWRSSAFKNVKVAQDQPLYEIPPGYTLLKENFKIRNGDEGSLYWSGMLYQSDAPFEAAWRTTPDQAYPAAVDPFRGADLYGALNSTPAYQVESLLPKFSEARLRASGRDYPDFIQERYTRLPPGVPERVFALARKLTSTSATPDDEAAAIERFLREYYPYTLDVPLPPVGADVADYFLFNLKKGYCDYYATAMVVLARSVGIPARMVMGYASGTYDPPSATYVVTAADAHAWVEIYFPGAGWVEFEPTAAQPAILRSAVGGIASAQKPVPAQQWDKILRSVYRLPAAARLVFTGLLVVLAAVGVIFLLEGWILGLARPASALRWMYRSVYRQGRRLAGPPVPGQTASEFSDKLQGSFSVPDSRLETLTSLYLKIMFSPQAVQKRELLLAVRAWRGLRWKLLWARKSSKPAGE